jgi:hypothetical protein
MWDKKPFGLNISTLNNNISTYILYSQEKSYLFSMWDLKLIRIYTLYSQ